MWTNDLQKENCLGSNCPVVRKLHLSTSSGARIYQRGRALCSSVQIGNYMSSLKVGGTIDPRGRSTMFAFIILSIYFILYLYE